MKRADDIYDELKLLNNEGMSNDTVKNDNTHRLTL